MRRRSGALHSEDYESYLELSKITKIGMFYEQESSTRHRRKHPQPAQRQVIDFEFDRAECWREEQLHTVDKKIHTVSGMVIFLNSHTENSLSPAPKETKIPVCPLHSQVLQADKLCLNRTVELVIHNFKVSQDEQTVAKIWLNYNPQLPIFSTYYKHIQTYFIVGLEPSADGNLVRALISDNRKGLPTDITSVTCLLDPLLEAYLRMLPQRKNEEAATSLQQTTLSGKTIDTRT